MAGARAPVPSRAQRGRVPGQRTDVCTGVVRGVPFCRGLGAWGPGAVCCPQLQRAVPGLAPPLSTLQAVTHALPAAASWPLRLTWPPRQSLGAGHRLPAPHHTHTHTGPSMSLGSPSCPDWLRPAALGPSGTRASRQAARGLAQALPSLGLCQHVPASPEPAGTAEASRKHADSANIKALLRAWPRGGTQE